METFSVKPLWKVMAIYTLLLTQAMAEQQTKREHSSIRYDEDQCRAQYRKMDPIDLKRGGCFEHNTPYGNCFLTVGQSSDLTQISDKFCLTIAADIAFNIHPASWLWENGKSFDQFKQDLAHQLLGNKMFVQSLNASELAEMKKVSKGSNQ